ncbi:fluoroquinolone transport system ATP-binding protein [Gracilibacillus ureilyticus]|uniref:Fluoroquinolone transport system ATP-binding protein n=1 Tax=Gracilibacillus ureilyticus TaxID=531814 RepID=A0A1H9U9L1_9BACI|nr:ABC transporter ATP-binding protein [Gracilibacillus ureilyticus]SES05847.1 fluoroquinolone transport system ATP-binding protein [Gracilibacillus ureilyticus]
MIHVKDVTYRYPNKTEATINNISFDVANGEIFGFLGPSGAGKSTTQKILIGILKGYKGTAKINQQELHKINADYYEQIGVGFEFPNFYHKFTGLENLQFFSKLYKKKTRDPHQLLASVGLTEAANVKFSHYSKGMKMRLNFCRVLLNDPDILFLDEPTSGLDPINAQNLRDLILMEKEKGKTIIITTHHMDTADKICDRVAFMADGEIALIDQPKQLKISYGEKNLQVEYRTQSDIKKGLFPLDQLHANKHFQHILAHHEILTMHTQEATLEDIFIKVTGRKLK